MTQIRTNILNPISPDATELLRDHVIGLTDSQISSIEPYDSLIHQDCQDKRHQICLPGLIDLHTHLSQYYIRGQFKPALLPWLSDIVFPEESRSADAAYAGRLSQDFFNALLRCGTTTAVIYTAPQQIACDTAFEIAEQIGYRAIIGMTLMDMNSPSSLLQTTDYAYHTSIELYHKWHARSALLDYIFTPRFAPTCSRELMGLIGRFCQDHKARIQSHLSENKAEITWVKDIFQTNSYTKVYEQYGILGPHTIMAHGIHLSKAELCVLKATDTRIAHCPDSNFFLKSGEFALERIKAAGLHYGLGSDVGAGTSLSMLYHAKLMNFRQSSYPVSPEEALYSITLGSAEVLGMQDSIGSLKAGKQADMLFVSLEDRDLDDLDSIISKLVFYGHEYEVSDVYVAGKKLI